MRDREHMHKRARTGQGGGGPGSREREREKQSPRIPGSDLGRRQMPHQLSHPGTQNQSFFKWLTRLCNLSPYLLHTNHTISQTWQACCNFDSYRCCYLCIERVSPSKYPESSLLHLLQIFASSKAFPLTTPLNLTPPPDPTIPYPLSLQLHIDLTCTSLIP